MEEDIQLPTSHNFKNLTGLVFGKLTVIKYNGKAGKNKNSMWLCKCECGNEKSIRTSHLTSNLVISCGCYGKTRGIKHNKHKTPEYRAWIGMKQRCYNQKFSKYHLYGGKGITVCDRWLESFENFYEDMGDRPKDKTSLDRINSDLGYSKENCRWATDIEQSNNTNRNVFITFNGKTQTITQWAHELNISANTLSGRLSKGWTVERSLTTPIQKRPTIIYDGIELTYKEWANKLGFDEWTIPTRLKLGWTIERALTTPLLEIKKYKYNNEEFTLKEWSEKIGISIETIQSRLSNGWDFEKIVTTPIQIQFSRKGTNE
jgi:hypothetical protein